MSDRSELDPFVRVVVLNWNAAWLTTRCIRSIQKTDYPVERFEIVVVDNASIDGSLSRLRADIDGVRFIENATNLGFAEGNNRALRDLDGVDYVALVNNDARVDPNWLRPLVDAMSADPSVGAAAPKLLLEAEFATVHVQGTGTLDSIEVDGVDVTRRCIYDGVNERPHDTVPLAFVRTVTGSAMLHVPVGGNTPQVTIRWTGGESGLEVAASTDSRRSDVAVATPIDDGVRLTLTNRRDRRVNSLGIDLTPWTEGTERWFGELDRPNLGHHDVWGFTGGGVLLRSAMLRDVGVFDPSFFAYYEDTDLSWRARRRGWRVECVPESVIHHLHGGSAGPEAQGFFFLNYRNWLLTALRNAGPRQLFSALSVARRLSWGPFRRNVFGPLRRLHRPDLTITAAWARVFAGLASSLPAVVASRVRGAGRPGGAAVGTAATDGVVSRLMPSTPPRPPRPRPGGPTLCYIDVTETLRSGWRAGIQRVVCELVRELPRAHPDIELVPVCWSKTHEQFRRIDSAEYARLLAPTATQQPSMPAPSPGRVRRLLARLMHRSGTAGLVHAVRRQRELRAVSPEHRVLLLYRFEPGSVFLDVDASWNPTTRPRADLLPDLVAGGVRTVMFLHDLLPQTHPQWFIPQLVDVSSAHLHAHLEANSSFVCNSEHTAATLARYAADLGAAAPNASVAPMGSTTSTVPSRPRSDAANATDVPERPFVVVGTVEPRKNHAVVLDAFEKVRVEHPDARLVVVGRPGWRSDAVIGRLRHLADSPSGGVVWRSDASDDELAELYARALAVVVASATEGFGLPVVEALNHGAVVLSSNGGGLPEAGGDHVEYFDPTSVDELALLMSRHLDDPVHHEERRRVASAFDPVSWSATAAATGDAIVAAASGAAFGSTGTLR